MQRRCFKLLPHDYPPELVLNSGKDRSRRRRRQARQALEASLGGNLLRVTRIKMLRALLLLPRVRRRSPWQRQASRAPRPWRRRPPRLRASAGPKSRVPRKSHDGPSWRGRSSCRVRGMEVAWDGTRACAFVGVGDVGWPRCALLCLGIMLCVRMRTGLFFQSVALGWEGKEGSA